MDEIAPNKHQLDSWKGPKEEWEVKVAKYPSLKKLDDQGEDAVESHDGREARMLQFVKNHKDLEQMKDNPKRVLEAIDEYAAEHEFMIHVGSDKAKIINNLILENKPRVLVELGGYCGYSAIMFADQMRAQAASAQTVEVYSLEKEEEFATIARDLISLAGVQEYITVITGDAGDSVKQLKKDGKIDHIDFLFLDHAEDLYARDLKVVMDELDLLRENACIVADNCKRPGAPEYLEYVNSHSDLRTRTLKALIMPGEFEDEISISKVLSKKENEETSEQRRGVGMGVI